MALGRHPWHTSSLVSATVLHIRWTCGLVMDHHKYTCNKVDSNCGHAKHMVPMVNRVAWNSFRPKAQPKEADFNTFLRPGAKSSPQQGTSTAYYKLSCRMLFCALCCHHMQAFLQNGVLCLVLLSSHASFSAGCCPAPCAVITRKLFCGMLSCALCCHHTHA